MCWLDMTARPPRQKPHDRLSWALIIPIRRPVNAPALIFRSAEATTHSRRPQTSLYPRVGRDTVSAFCVVESTHDGVWRRCSTELHITSQSVPLLEAWAGPSRERGRRPLGAIADFGSRPTNPAPR